MIFIDRSRVPVPPSLLDAGADERDRATAFYADPDNHSKPFPFKAYKAPDVVGALEVLFRGKCAYCESSYAPTQPADIEHFRPKGAVVIEQPGARPQRRKPGYYWLAADWDNLLPSCIDCNRARTQEFPDDDRRLVRGKENRFPLADESRRSAKPEDPLDDEERLLVHPCQDRPGDHLEFLASGLIREREGSTRGRTTIGVLALQRKALKEARRTWLELAAEKMDEVLHHVIDFDVAPTEQLARRIEVGLRRLRRMARADQPYAGVVGPFVAGFEAALEDGTVRAFVADLFATVTAQELV